LLRAGEPFGEGQGHVHMIASPRPGWRVNAFREAFREYAWGLA
jgi:hypothetical protein